MSKFGTDRAEKTCSGRVLHGDHAVAALKVFRQWSLVGGVGPVLHGDHAVAALKVLIRSSIF